MESDNILRTFAAVSDGAVAENLCDVVGPRPFAWTTYNSLDFFRDEEKRLVVRLADKRWNGAYDEILAMGRAHYNEGMLRMGWIWFSGAVERDGQLAAFCFPAISASINRPLTTLGSMSTTWERLGEPQVTPLIEDLHLRHSLLEGQAYLDDRVVDRLDPLRDGGVEEIPFDKLAEMTGLMTWCRDVAVAVGLRVEQTFSLHGLAPIERRFEPGIALHVGCGLYVSQPLERDSASLSLSKLANSPGIRESAFSLVYGDRELTERPRRKITSFRPLSTHQRKVVESVAVRDLSVISGAPGTGKSHVLSVIAGDAVASGQSVLVAAGSAHAVDVLVDHFSEIPGPPPITFGGVRYGSRLLEELAEVESAVLVGRRDALKDVPNIHADIQDERHERIRRHLLIEAYHSQWVKSPELRLEDERRLNEAGSLKRLGRLVKRIGGDDELLVTPLSRKAGEELRRKLGGHGSFEEQLRQLEALKAALDRRARPEGSFDEEFDQHRRNESRAIGEGGAVLKQRWMRSVGTAEQLLLQRLRRILSNPSTNRRHELSSLQGRGLTRATPLWIGSVDEIDDVLPAIPRMFDLVILDEAAQIGQLEAASALSRAHRAIICGDPRQITYRSYLSKESFERAAFGHRTDADWLQPQSRSTFDVAAAQVPIHVLDEHFRSVPQLIGFSSKNFYEDNLQITTRTPANENAKRISVAHVAGTRDGSSKNVNQAEVDECVRIVDTLAEKGWRSIGLISPFRAQADALTKAVESRHSQDDIERWGLRIGTVHQFQGDEREVIVVSFAIGAGEAESSWNFVNQPDLFNVMVTRARENLIVVTSNDSPPGFAGNYVRWANEYSPSTEDVPIDHPWIQTLVAAFEAHGIRCRSGYRVGRYLIDIVVGAGESAVAIDAVVNIDDLDAHVDRAMLLRRAGWRTTDAYETKWAHEPDAFVRSLLEEFPKLRVPVAE